MRLLVLLNESEPGAHDDVHRALDLMRRDGTLASHHVIPFPARLRSGSSASDIRDEVVRGIQRLGIETILIAHVAELPIPTGWVTSLRERFGVRVGYWDGDLYERPYKPLPKSVLTAGLESNVAFFPGDGPTTRELADAGCRDIRYVPLTTDEVRFSVQYDEPIEYDVILIGNYVSRRFPPRPFPGSRWRRDVARLFHERLGSRFAVFGSGWRESFVRGPVPYLEQGRLYRRARIALGVNNLHARYYFSDRLPIALSAGRLMLHNHEGGIESPFRPIGYRSFFRDSDQAWTMAREMLELSPEEIRFQSTTARDYALRNLSMGCALRYMAVVLSSTLAHNPWGVPHLLTGGIVAGAEP